jgi:hypothetical protein
MIDFILDEMDKENADGVDFVPIWFGDKFPPIIKSMTREEVMTTDAYPKSNRLYWRMVDGHKVYTEPLHPGVKNTRIIDLSEEFENLF